MISSVVNCALVLSIIIALRNALQNVIERFRSALDAKLYRIADRWRLVDGLKPIRIFRQETFPLGKSHNGFKFFTGFPVLETIGRQRVLPNFEQQALQNERRSCCRCAPSDRS